MIKQHQKWNSVFAGAALLLVSIGAQAQDGGLTIKPNMERLKAAKPNTTYRFVGSSAAGQLFFPGEPVNVQLVFTKGQDSDTVKDFAIEIQEITTRDPEARASGMEGFTDTAGHAPLIGLQGKPVLHPISVTFDDKPEVKTEVANLPVPARFGTYALTLVRGTSRQFLASVARVPTPRPYGTVLNVPVFGEGQMIEYGATVTQRAQMYYRMGVRGWRSELSWSEREDGTYDWSRYDNLFNAAKAAGVKVMVTLGGHPTWTYPFTGGQPTPASGWTTKTGGYWGTADWLCKPELYPRYGKWIQAFCERYWENGKGALWGLENYNEPWEGGGISGWARDALQYRELQRTIATAARAVSPDIKVLAASSIMNTEDKLYSDGGGEFNKYIDIFTDHYVPPPMCYGPMVARAHGKESMETETWFVNSEYLLPQGVAQFMASGQARIAPWHPRVLFERLPGTNDPYFIPTPVVAATAAFNYFVTGKTFEKIVFQEHLPWVFQFGKDSDKDALLVVFGQLMTIGGQSDKERLWAQVDGSPGGTMQIDNRDGLLRFFDLAGNPMYEKQKTVNLPMNIFPAYITCAKGPVAASARLAKAKISGKRPVEILPHDFARPVAAGTPLTVELHNCLNRAISGKLSVTAPTGITLAAPEQAVKLAAGERKALTFALTAGAAQASNSYPFSFNFTSDGGDAAYAEDLNVAVVARGTKTIDGNLDDWSNVPGITLVAKAEKTDATELLRRPWLEVKEKSPDGTFGEVKLAWDNDNLYIAARVNDPTPEKRMFRFATRDENAYFHTAADDKLENYAQFLATRPGKSFGEVPYIYANSPEAGIPFRRDRLQFAIDATPGWHDMAPAEGSVPYGFHAVPDSDYEYSLYACEGGSELWRHLAPGVPRIHDFPRQVRGAVTTGAVEGARTVVRREGNVYTYEASIPRGELKTLDLKAGSSFGFAFKIGNSAGPGIDYGVDKAMTKINGLTLHPYWERSPNCGTRWTLGE